MDKPFFQQATYEAMSLGQLAAEALVAAENVERQTRSIITNARNAGAMLLAAKSKVKHGEWNQWLESNWVNHGASVRSAQRYMKLARFEGDLSDAGSVKQALAMVSESLWDQKRHVSHLDSAAQLDASDVPTEPESSIARPANDRSPTKTIPVDGSSAGASKPERSDRRSNPAPTVDEGDAISAETGEVEDGSPVDPIEQSRRVLEEAEERLNTLQAEELANWHFARACRLNPSLKSLTTGASIEEPKDAPPFDEILTAYNAAFDQKARMTPGRRSKLKTRWKDTHFRDNWQEALEIGGKSSFFRGENDRGWKIGFDFFLRPDTVTKILEGQYQGSNRGDGPRIRGNDEGEFDFFGESQT